MAKPSEEKQSKSRHNTAEQRIGTKAKVAVPEKRTSSTKAKVVVPAKHASHSLYVCRIAVALLQLPRGTKSMFLTPEATELGVEVESNLRRALKADSRVSELIEAKSQSPVDIVRTLEFYDPDKLTPNLKSEDDDTFLSMRLPQPLTFRLHIPQRVQPKYRSSDDVPTDSYTVIWNGVVAAVQWSPSNGIATLSGGHVVLEVLKEVASAAGYEMKVLACDPTCLHKFIHADVVTFDHDHSPPAHFEVSGPNATGETVVSPFRYTTNDLNNLQQIYGAIYSSVERYAEAKTIADRIRAVEWFARESTSRLLHLNYQKASRASFPKIQALRDIWKTRRFRKESKELLAAMWYSLASVEDLRRFWKHLQREFSANLTKDYLTAFENSLDIHREEIESLDMSFVGSAVQDAGSRWDSRALILATTLGATMVLVASFIAKIGQ